MLQLSSHERGAMDDVDSDSGSYGEPTWRIAAVLVQTCDKYSWFWPAWHFFFHRCAFASLSLPTGRSSTCTLHAACHVIPVAPQELVLPETYF